MDPVTRIHPEARIHDLRLGLAKARLAAAHKELEIARRLEFSPGAIAALEQRIKTEQSLVERVEAEAPEAERIELETRWMRQSYKDLTAELWRQSEELLEKSQEDEPEQPEG